MVASNILLPKPKADTEIIAGVDDGVITTVLLQVARTEQVIAGDGMAGDSTTEDTSSFPVDLGQSSVSTKYTKQQLKNCGFKMTTECNPPPPISLTLVGHLAKSYDHKIDPIFK